MSAIKIKLQSVTSKLPTRGSVGAAGWDLYADLGNPDASIIIPEFQRRDIPTGISVELEEGSYWMITSRSGRARKEGLIVLNAPGVIDSDYRGWVSMLMLNTSQKPIVIKHGERIAQAIVQHYETPCFEVVSALSKSERGEKGWGSTS